MDLGASTSVSVTHGNSHHRLPTRTSWHAMKVVFVASRSILKTDFVSGPVGIARSAVNLGEGADSMRHDSFSMATSTALQLLLSLHFGLEATPAIALTPRDEEMYPKQLSCHKISAGIPLGARGLW